MICDIGGGTTEVAVISLGGIVFSTSLRIAGDEMDEAIVGYMRRRFNVLIGESTAELLKKNIGSIHPTADRSEMQVRGRNLLSGLPTTITINSANIREAITEPVSHIVDALRTTLENTPPELSGDIYDSGIMLAGGGALLAGLDVLLSGVTGIRVLRAKHPLDAVAIGIGRVIESEDKYPGAVMYRTR